MAGKSFYLMMGGAISHRNGDRASLDLGSLARAFIEPSFPKLGSGHSGARLTMYFGLSSKNNLMKQSLCTNAKLKWAQILICQFNPGSILNIELRLNHLKPRSSPKPTKECYFNFGNTFEVCSRLFLSYAALITQSSFNFLIRMQSVTFKSVSDSWFAWLPHDQESLGPGFDSWHLHLLPRLPVSLVTALQKRLS